MKISLATVVILWAALAGLTSTVHGEEECHHEPTVLECRPYIEAALRQYVATHDHDADSAPIEEDETPTTDEEDNAPDESLPDLTNVEEEGSDHEGDGESTGSEETPHETENEDADVDDKETPEEETESEQADEGADETSEESADAEVSEGQEQEEKEEQTEERESEEVADAEEHKEGEEEEEEEEEEGTDEEKSAEEVETEEGEEGTEEEATEETAGEEEAGEEEAGEEVAGEEEAGEEVAGEEEVGEEETTEEVEEAGETTEEVEEAGEEEETAEAVEETSEEAVEETAEAEEEAGEETSEEASEESTEAVAKESAEDEKEPESTESSEPEEEAADEATEEAAEGEAAEDEEEEQVIVEGPGLLRTRDHIEDILGLNEEATSGATSSTAKDISIRDLKRLYESAVRPLESLYKFRDISNRHLGDAELFSHPILVFLGPWGSGKSTIVNYLLGIEDTPSAIKRGADPNTNSFTVIMYGDAEQVIDGTQLAADWAFSSLQKFGQSFLDRLQGRRLPNPLLRKVTIVDTPGILENRKSLDRLYPYNDACQWFIDRADLIFITFDPTKLDVGLELEALFDQLKGREANVRLLLNKADNVGPRELMRIQNTLLWNLSPLIGTPEPPVFYSGSFWSRPFLPTSTSQVLEAGEIAMLEDIRDAVEHQVEHKVALARRHAVRVRNHAKMVDCYLNTYYNHKTFFSNKKKVAEEIVDNPQQFHIYEGLSTMTNVSRYDLPDPDVYKEFFRLHPLFDFKPLSSTCSYFKGCPLDKLDIAIAYDLPEIVGKYRNAIAIH